MSEWAGFKRLVHNYRLNNRKMKMFTHYSKEAFDDFPKFQPDRVKDEWYSDFSKLSDAISVRLEKSNDETVTVSGSAFFEDKVMIVISNFASGVRNPLSLDFTENVYEQGLVMIYSLLDAFFNDTLRMICQLNNGVLLHTLNDKEKNNKGENEKYISWNDVVKLGDYTKIIDSLIDDFTYRISMKSVKDKIIFFRDKLNIDLSLTTDLLNSIVRGEHYRHCIVHRGGYVDDRLINSLNDTNLKPGEKIVTDFDFLNKLYENFEIILNSIYKEVSLNYFKVAPDIFDKERGNIDFLGRKQSEQII